MDIVELRKKAEALLKGDQRTIPTADVSHLLQELEIHQIELELQNAELQAAQAEIELLRQRYFDLYMFAPIGYLVIDANGQIEDANLAACRLLGKERHYVISRPLSKYFAPQSRSRFFELLNTVFEVEVPQQAEFVLNPPTGNQQGIYVAALIQTFYERDRHLARLALTDISEHVRAEKQQAEKVEQYRVLFDTSHSVKLIIDPDTGDIIDANQKACQFYGYPKDILTQMRITEINQLPPDEVNREMQRARVEQRQYFNFRHCLANGEIRDVEVFSGPIEMHGRTLLYSIIHDITDLKEKEAEHRLLWHAVNQNASSVIITDASGNIEYVNPYFTRVTGYTHSEVFGKNPRILKSGHTSEDDYAEMWQTITSGQEWTGEFHNRKKNGDLFWERATISPVIEYDGTISHFVAIKEDITVEKQALEQLKQKEYTLRRSQSLAHVGDWTWDTRTNTVTWSDEMYRIFGVDQDTFTGDLTAIIERAIHPDDRDRVNASNEAVINEQRPGGLEYRVVWPDGTIRHVWAQPGETTTDKDGNILTLSGIVQDITERKATLEELKHKEFMLRRSQSIARIGAWTWDIKSDTVEWDDEMYNNLGIVDDSFSGSLIEVIQNIVHPDDRERVISAIPAALESESTEGLEYRILQPDGSVRHIWLLPGEREKDSDGKLISVSGIVQDITDRKEAEILVREMEERYRKITELLSDYAYSIDVLEDGTFVRDWVTASFESITGYSSAQLDEKGGWTSLIHPDDLVIAKQRARNMLAGQPDISEFRFVRADGEVRWLRDFGYAVYDSNQGRVVRIYGAAQDITEHKRASIRVQQAERFARSTVDALSAHIAILDETGTILDVNEAWTRFAEQNGGDAATTGVGVNYLAVLRAVAPNTEDADTAKVLFDGIRRVTSGEVDSFTLEYPCHAPHEKRWFVARVTRFDTDNPTRVVIAHENITERVMAEQALQRQKQALAERVKELNGLYQHSRVLEQPGISLDTLYQGTIDLIPAAWQYPEITRARLNIDGTEYLTDGFHDTEWQLISPIVVDGQQIGQLEVCYLEDRPTEFEGPFLEQERFLIDELARRLSQKIKETRSEERLQLEAETQAVILRLLDSDTPDQNSFIELALEEAVKVTNSTIGYFHFVNRDEVSLNLFTWSKGVLDQCTTATDPHYPLEKAGIWADCVRIKQPVIHNDYATLEHKQGLPEGHFPLMRHMSVPIMDGDKPVAVLGVGNKPQDYSDMDVVRLTLMSSTLWNWIQRKRAVTEIQRQNTEIRAINRVISLSTTTLDPEEVANMACRELSSALEAISVVFGILEEHSGDYRVVAVSSLQSPNENQVGTVLVRAGDPVLDVLERYGIPQIANGSSPESLGQCILPTCKQNALIIPVKQRSSLAGLFCVAFEPEHQFTDRELGFAANIVQVVSQALENSRLHQQVAKHNEELSILVDERTAELKRTNGRLNIVLNNVTNPILLIDNEGNIDITNPAFNRDLGYEIDELFGYPLIQIFAPEKRSEIASLLDTLQEQRQIRPIEAKVIAKDGTLLEVEVAFAYVEGNSGHVVCTLYDISHIKEVERIKDQFVSMVSHELRTPITSMLLGSNIMQQYYDRLSDEQKRRKLTQIHQQAQLLSDLVTSVLDISRMEARLGQRCQDSIDLADVLRQVVSELEEQAAQKQQTIEVEVMNSVLSVPGDRADITRIWHNLLGNAVKYTQVGGHISARLFGACTSGECHLPDLSDFADSLPDDLYDGHYIIGIVEDNGHGIRAEDMPQLFTRFFRGWAAGTSITGTGLGLSLVREILHHYGGDIAVRSDLGLGTTFCFWLFAEETGQKG